MRFLRIGAGCVVLVGFLSCSPLLVPNADDARCIPAPSGIVSWWPGEGSAADIKGRNDGQVQGPVTYAPGMVGQSFQFNGFDDVVTPTNGFPVIAEDRTIEMWVDLTSPGYDGEELTFAAYGLEGANSASVLFGASLFPNVVSPPGPLIGASDWNEVLLGPALSLNTWHHVALTISSADFVMYVDGQPNASEYMPVQTESGSQFYIGGPGFAPSPSGFEHFQGLADEVSIYNRALTASEIKAIYEAGSAGKCHDVSSPPPSSAGDASAERGPDAGIDVLGTVWHEQSGDWTDTWTRQGSTSTFSAVGTMGGSTVLLGNIIITVSGSNISISSTDTSGDAETCEYTGTFWPGNESASGTFLCGDSPPIYSWEATITH